MPHALQVSVHDRLDPVMPAEWERLFPDLVDPLGVIQLVQDVGMDGCDFRSILVRQGEKAVLLLPLFVLRLDLSRLVERRWRGAVALGARVLPALRPRVLGVGFIEGENGAVGVDAAVGPDVLAQAWSLAGQAYGQLARTLRASVEMYLNFTSESARWIPPSLVNGFVPIPTYPTGSLAISFASEEAYLASLSKSTRKDFRRKLRAAVDVRITFTREIGPYLDAIVSLYQGTVDRSEMSMGVQRRGYFERIGAVMPGAVFGLYHLGEDLLAFNLLVHHRDRLIDKYFCMDPVRGPERNLYFLSWMENVRYCLNGGISLYHAGPGAEATKARLGASMTATLTLARHRNRLIHPMVARVRSALAYEPEIELPPAVAGQAWRV